MDSDWKEELEILFQDFENGYVTEQETREQIEQWHREETIPEDELETIYTRFEDMLADKEEQEWERELSLAYANYDDDNKEYVN